MTAMKERPLDKYVYSAIDRKARRSAQMGGEMTAKTTMPLTFATFYTCGIKRFTNLTQRICINLLLRDGYSDSKEIDILSDSVCSNYAKGKKALNSELQVELLNLSVEDIVERLHKIGIQNYTTVSDSLQILVENSSLSVTEKRELLECRKSENELGFVAAVFQKCIRGDNYHPLTSSDIAALENYRYRTVSTNDAGAVPAVSDAGRAFTQVKDTEQDMENDAELDWMRDYVPASLVNEPVTFVRSTVKSHHVAIELPLDYRALVYALKPALTEDTLQTFTLEKFMETMDIDAAHIRLQRGSLEYWKFEGALDSILQLLERISFADVSDFAFQMMGQFTLEEAGELQRYLKNISNSKAAILSSLLYDKELSQIKVILIAHRCSEKAAEQRLADDDDTHVYKIQRKLNNTNKG